MAIKYINGFEFYDGSPLKMINQFKTDTGLSTLRKPVGYSFFHDTRSTAIQVAATNAWGAMMLKKTDGVSCEIAMRIRYISRDTAAMGWSPSILFASANSPVNSVNLQIDIPAAGSSTITASLTKVISNSAAALVSTTITASESESSSTDMLLRLRKQGTTFKAKAWLDGTSEPSTWLESTISEASAFNNVGVLLAGGTQHVIIKNVAIADAGETAPLSITGGNRTVAGPIKKPDGSPANNYTVRLYHKDSGVMIGEQKSDINGLFSFSVPVLETDLVEIIGVDDIGGTWKPPIHETYPSL